MSLVFLSFLLAGCAVDVGTVTVTCTFDYTFGETHETGDWPGYSTDCDNWAESGEQGLESTRGACEQAGLDADADAAECVCGEDVGTCKFPNGVND